MTDRAIQNTMSNAMTGLFGESLPDASPLSGVDYGALQAMRDSTLTRIEALKSRLRTQPEAGSRDEGDRADQASDLVDRSQMAWLIQTLEAKVHELERAIERAIEGQYGLCSRCGLPIPPERLALVPETSLCVACASAHEQRARREAARYDVEGIGDEGI